MARDMNTVPDFIRDQKTGSFAVFVRDKMPSAISMRFPLNPLARFARMTIDERSTVRKRNREKYAGQPEPSKKSDELPRGRSRQDRNLDDQ